MQLRTCKPPPEGCGEPKDVNEFRLVRVNKNTGEAYRQRICIECRNKSRRKPKKLITEPELYKQLDQLMRGIT